MKGNVSKPKVEQLINKADNGGMHVPGATVLSDGAMSLGKNTIAGSKCFNITAFDDTNKAYTLDSVEGLAVGDVFSLKLKANYDNYGKITAINNSTVIVDKYHAEEPNSSNLFRVPAKPNCGTTDFGFNAFAEGENCIAAGDNSHASGKNTRANGRYAHTEGKNTEASYAGHAEGVDTIANGEIAHAAGYDTTANGNASHSEGSSTTANGNVSHSEGAGTIANGYASHSEGASTTANGYGAHSEGINTAANGDFSHSEGDGTQAKGYASHSEGEGTIANGNHQHVQGGYNKVDTENKYAVIVGNGSGDAHRSNAYTLDWAGNGWFYGDVATRNGDKLSEKANTTMVKTELDKKQGISNMVSSVEISTPLTDEQYPSAKALQNVMESTAIEFSNLPDLYQRTSEMAQSIVPSSGEVNTYSQYPSVNAVYESVSALSNALKGKKTGSVVRIDDVSPVSHNMNVHVQSENLIPFPYTYLTTNNGVGSVTKNGVTFTVNEDRVITVSGNVSTDYIYSDVILGKVNVQSDTYYTISYEGDLGAHDKIRVFSSTNRLLANVGAADAIKTFKVTYDDAKGDNTVTIRLVRISYEETATDCTFRPKLELGSTATPYVDYVDVSGAVLKSQGKNLIPSGKGDSTTKTSNGITFTRKSDGSVVANGTATATATYSLNFSAQKFLLPAGNYTLSGCLKNGSASTYRLDLATEDTTVFSDTGNGRSVLIPPNIKVNIIAIYVSAGTTVSNVVFRPQLELGTVATEYEPYKSGSSHYVESDGSIAGGVDNVSPTTTLTCDEANTVIVAEYNRDINKAFAELESKITAQTSAE